MAGSRLTSNTPEARAAIATRLDYNLRGEQPAAMSALALFWPHPGLAQLADPLQLARTRPHRPIVTAVAEREVARRLSPLLPRASVARPAIAPTGMRYSAGPERCLACSSRRLRSAEALAGEEAADSGQHDAAERSRGLHAHIRLAVEATGSTPQAAVGDGASSSRHWPRSPPTRQVTSPTDPSPACSARTTMSATLACGRRPPRSRPG